MTEPKRFFLAAAFAAFNFVAFAGAALVFYRSELRHSAESQAETAERQAYVDATQRQLLTQSESIQDLRDTALRQHAASDAALAALRGELDTQRAAVESIRNQAAAVPATVFIEPQGLVEWGGRVPAVQIRGRSWGPEQATGEPDTPAAGDFQTAWASHTQDGQNEWLQLDYAEAVLITKVKVHESYNPGALSKVSIFDDDGKEVEVWRGKDPTPTTATMGVSEVTLATPRKSKRVKIYLNSMEVPGWNEIDAVGIVDDAQKTYWAVSATASSTFAEQNDPIAPANAQQEAVPGGKAEVPFDLF